MLEIDDPPIRAVSHRRALRDRARVAARRAVRRSARRRQPAAAGAQRAPVLPSIPSGPDKGQHLLAVQNTTTPVGLDQLADITRLPQQQRLQLDHLRARRGPRRQRPGAQRGAAARRSGAAADRPGDRRAGRARTGCWPASPTSPTGSSSRSRHSARTSADSSSTSATVAGAAAAQGAAIEDNLEAFPPFLRQLKPAARAPDKAVAPDRLRARSRSAAQAPSINASLKGLGPLATSAIPGAENAGQRRAARGVRRSRGSTESCRQLLSLAKPLQPLAVEPRGAVEQLRQRRRHRGRDAVHLLLHRRGQRRGRARPLRALELRGRQLLGALELSGRRLRLDVRDDDRRQGRGQANPAHRRQAIRPAAKRRIPDATKALLDYLLSP